MNMRETKFYPLFRLARAGAVAAVLCAFAGTAAAQGPDPGAMASQYAANARQNATLLRQYAWQMRVEVTLKGEVKPAQIYQLRFDEGGKLQKTLLTAPQEQDNARGIKGRIKGRIKENKIEEFKEWAEKLSDMVKGYMAPTPGTMMDFYAKASFSKAPDGTVQISAGAFIQPGDKATFWVDPATKIPVRYAFQTVLGEDPVSAKVEFGAVQGGPQYAARVVVDAPSKKVSAKIENFGYQRQ